MYHSEVDRGKEDNTQKNTIAIIKKNKCYFDKLGDYIEPYLYKNLTPEERIQFKKKLHDYLWSIIEPHIVFLDVKEDEIMEKICLSLVGDHHPDEYYYCTEGSYSSPKKYLELIYSKPYQKEKNEEKEMNILGCLFSLSHSVILYDCALIGNKFDLQSPHFMKIDSVSKEDIFRVIRRRFFFSSILIKDNEFQKYYYQNPQYLICQVFNMQSTETIQTLSFSLLKYNLVLYFKDDTTQPINKIATRLNGIYKIYGDVLVLHEMEESIYTNLSLHEIKRLNVLSYGRRYDRELKPEENFEIHASQDNKVDRIDTNNQNTKPKIPLWSRYLVLENRMKIWKEKKDKCMYCMQKMEKTHLCQNCFRIRYCSKECEKAYRELHNDCISSRI
jgi:hypothetical protein